MYAMDRFVQSLYPSLSFSSSSSRPLRHLSAMSTLAMHTSTSASTMNHTPLMEQMACISASPSYTSFLTPATFASLSASSSTSALPLHSSPSALAPSSIDIRIERDQAVASVVSLFPNYSPHSSTPQPTGGAMAQSTLTPTHYVKQLNLMEVQTTMHNQLNNVTNGGMPYQNYFNNSTGSAPSNSSYPPPYPYSITQSTYNTNAPSLFGPPSHHMGGLNLNSPTSSYNHLMQQQQQQLQQQQNTSTLQFQAPLNLSPTSQYRLDMSSNHPLRAFLKPAFLAQQTQQQQQHYQQTTVQQQQQQQQQQAMQSPMQYPNYNLSGNGSQGVYLPYTPHPSAYAMQTQHQQQMNELSMQQQYESNQMQNQLKFMQAQQLLPSGMPLSPPTPLTSLAPSTAVSVLSPSSSAPSRKRKLVSAPSHAHHATMQDEHSEYDQQHNEDEDAAAAITEAAHTFTITPTDKQTTSNNKNSNNTNPLLSLLDATTQAGKQSQKKSKKEAATVAAVTPTAPVSDAQTKKPARRSAVPSSTFPASSVSAPPPSVSPSLPPHHQAHLISLSLEPALDPSTGAISYHCRFPACSDHFKTRFSLKRHLKKHLGSKPYKCEFANCAKKFAEKSTLKRHVRIHTGEKPFKCSVSGCGKYFADRTNVKRHEMIHTGLRPYFCPYATCNRGYFWRKHLKKHMMAVHQHEFKVYLEGDEEEEGEEDEDEEGEEEDEEEEEDGEEEEEEEEEEEKEAMSTKKDVKKAPSHSAKRSPPPAPVRPSAANKVRSPASQPASKSARADDKSKKASKSTPLKPSTSSVSAVAAAATDGQADANQHTTTDNTAAAEKQLQRHAQAKSNATPIDAAAHTPPLTDEAIGSTPDEAV